MAGTGRCVEAPGCVGFVGPVGLWAQAPNTDAADTNMTNRTVRDMESSGWRERYRYRDAMPRTDIAGGIVIC